MDQIKREAPELRGAVDLLKAGFNPIPNDSTQWVGRDTKGEALFVLSLMAAFGAIALVVLLLRRLWMGC